MEGGLDTASILLVLDFEVVCGYIAGILLLNAGVDLVFRGIMDYNKIKLAILLKELVRI